MNKEVVIIGAGISGLTTAHWLNKEGYKIKVIEANPYVGGSMISEEIDGYLIDYGPNSGLETSTLIKTLIDDLDLKKEFIYANKEGNKRYILKNNELIPLPMNPKEFVSTKLFSAKAKLRLGLEPFIGKSNDGYYQSISEFVIRRLGREFLDYAINPFVAGVYAGNPDRLSVKSAFPKLFALEEKYGGLIKGTIKGAKERKKRGEESKQSAAMFSFKKGMATLPFAVAQKLGNKVLLNAEVISVIKRNGKFTVSYKIENKTNEVLADIVISTVPAYIAAKIFTGIDKKASEHLKQIYYPPVQVLYLGYDKKNISRNLDGFGFLIPANEKKKFLGALWSSVIFDNRVPENKAGFTLFIGGARSPELFKINNKKLVTEVIKEFQEIMKITGEPEFVKTKYWEHAIPQYNVGYIEHLKYFENFEIENPGIIFGGNYIGGISVGDCIKSSEVLFRKVSNMFKEK